METLKFLTREQIDTIKQNYVLPVYVYSEKILKEKARDCLNFPHAFGLTVRYAMKANSNVNILKLFDKMWIHIDASSSFEVYRAMENANIDPKKIQLTTQEIRYELWPLMKLGIHYNATSIYQLEEYGKKYPNTNLSIRINPGKWSWWTKRTSTWWVTSSFWIRYEYVDQVHEIVKKYSLVIEKIHIHIGSGSDPKVWKEIAQQSLSFVEQFPDVTTVNLGGGFKVARMQDEKATDLQDIGAEVKTAFQQFFEKTGRKLHLEIEPGSYLVANAGAIVGCIEDIVDTGNQWNHFIKADIGMPDILRPTLYGAQHPIIVVNDQTATQEYVVVGPCCESWDILTPAPGNSEEICPRLLNKAEIADILVVEWTGAYCASMSARNYNSYPVIAEILVREDWSLVTIRNAEQLSDIWKNEISVI